MNRPLLSAMLLAVVAVGAGCWDNSFTVETDGTPDQFDTTEIKLTVDADTYVLTGTGFADPIPNAVDDEHADTFRVVLDIGELSDLQTYQNYPISGQSSWDLGTAGAGWIPLDQVSFVPGEDHTPALSHVYFY